MSDLIIACLSQKGGVGKSTLTRLIARTYAAGGWDVKIADFNINQLTSGDWVGLRKAAGIGPSISVEATTQVRRLRNDPADLIVVDGAPDSQQSSLEVARLAHLVVIPTGLTRDDIKPQISFANELIVKGVDRGRILFVFNRTTESEPAVREARAVLDDQGLSYAETYITFKASYQMAQNIGYALSETKVASLNERAEALAAEIVAKATEQMEKAA